MLELLYQKFIPKVLQESVDTFYRCKIIVVIGFLGTGLLIPFIVIRFLLQGAHPYPYVLIAMTAGVFVTPWLLKWTKSLETSGLFFSLCTILGFTTMALVDGGITSPTTFGLVLPPIFGVFFSSFRGAVSIFLLTLICLAILTYTTASGMLPAASLDEDTLAYLIGGSAIGVIFALTCLSLVFIQWQETSRRKLVAANNAKDDFLSGMSHELRTPLNSVIGFTEILQKEYLGELNEKQQEQLSFIYASGEHLLALVEDLLELNELSNKKITLELEEINLENLLNFCVNSFQIDAENLNIKIEIDHSKANQNVTADSKRLKQILLNLLSNALKFTPDNSTIALWAKQLDNHLYIAIKDEGPGIPEEHHNRIFDKFYQVDSSSAKQSKGSGLGLFISRELARLHGGELSLSQSTTNGACFELTLPRQESINQQAY